MVYSQVFSVWHLPNCRWSSICLSVTYYMLAIIFIKATYNIENSNS